MSSFLNQALETLGQTKQTLSNTIVNVNSAVNVEELRVGSHHLIVKERLAEGGFGVVDLVTESHTKKDYVLKRCNIDQSASYEVVKKEINMLQRFSGPYIVKLIDSDTFQKNKNSTEALLLLDYCPGGHLLDRLKNRNGRSLPSESIFRIFGQILAGLRPFHCINPPIINRDLKLENILFGTDGTVKLCDFGSCVEGYISIKNVSERLAAEEKILKETTQMYRSPEMIDLYMRDILTEKTDIWALGCIFYSICFLVHPFQEAGGLGILNAKINFPSNSSSELLNCYEDVKSFILQMIDIDPEARPTIIQLIESTTAFSQGKPLPPYQLTNEAKKKREERIAANTVRENKKAIKKPTNVVPLKNTLPLDSNSVAARRLAVKRGDINVHPTVEKNKNKNESNHYQQQNEVNANFSFFDTNHNNDNKINNNNNNKVLIDDQTFDPFNNDSFQTTTKNISNSFVADFEPDLFSNSTAINALQTKPSKVTNKTSSEQSFSEPSSSFDFFSTSINKVSISLNFSMDLDFQANSNPSTINNNVVNLNTDLLSEITTNFDSFTISNNNFDMFPLESKTSNFESNTKKSRQVENENKNEIDLLDINYDDKTQHISPIKTSHINNTNTNLNDLFASPYRESNQHTTAHLHRTVEKQTTKDVLSLFDTPTTTTTTMRSSNNSFNKSATTNNFLNDAHAINSREFDTHKNTSYTSSIIENNKQRKFGNASPSILNSSNINYTTNNINNNFSNNIGFNSPNYQQKQTNFSRNVPPQQQIIRGLNITEPSKMITKDPFDSLNLFNNTK